MTSESSITSALIQSLSLTNCFAALAVYYILSLLYSIFFHPLRRVPGPFLARFSELWRNIRYFRGSWLDDVVSLHEKYGPVVRIAPNEISLVDGDALKQLYGHGKPSQKVGLTSLFLDWSFSRANLAIRLHGTTRGSFQAWPTHFSRPWIKRYTVQSAAACPAHTL
jgi:hypothetical protein